MTDTVISSATKEVVIGFDRPFVIIGERINPTGRKILAAEMTAGDFSRVEADARALIKADRAKAVFPAIGLGLTLDGLKFRANAVSQRFEPFAGGGLLDVEGQRHGVFSKGNCPVWRRASESAMPAETATFKERNPGCIGIRMRRSQAAASSSPAPSA